MVGMVDPVVEMADYSRMSLARLNGLLHYCTSAILQCMIIVGVLVYYFIVLEYCMDGLKQ